MHRVFTYPPSAGSYTPNMARCTFLKLLRDISVVILIVWLTHGFRMPLKASQLDVIPSQKCLGSSLGQKENILALSFSLSVSVPLSTK